MTEVITTVITTLGAVIVAYLPFYFQIKKHIDKKTEETKMHSDISVQKLNGLLTSVIHSFDRPCWLKIAVPDRNGNIEFRMSEVNDLYTQTFGIKRSQYIGRTDLEAGHNYEDAKRFYTHDMAVYASGAPETFTEKIKGVEMKFRKIRISAPDGKLKGVFGYQIY
jgi:hypothetical protein